MLTEVSSRGFSNGVTYMLRTSDGYPLEVTDTFLPYYTKESINEHANHIIDGIHGNRHNRWIIGVSCMSGCPVGCSFCNSGQLDRWRRLKAEEIFEQVKYVIELNKQEGWIPEQSQELKISYTRMGEPFLNIKNVKKAIRMIDEYLQNTRVQHHISTVGIKGSDFSWVKDNITLQVSLPSLNENRRHEVIPINNLMSLNEIGKIRTKSNTRTTLNMTLIDETDFDIEILKKHFSPDFFFIKLSPIYENEVSKENNIGTGIIKAKNLR